MSDLHASPTQRSTGARGLSTAARPGYWGVYTNH
jgi:hypothetical protein